MKTAMESIREMVDVNTVVGDAVEAPDGAIIIPISRVAVGFAAGGGEFEAGGPEEKAGFPFGGGSGAGLSVQPVGFLVVGKDQIRLLPVETNFAVDRLIDLAPQIIEKLDSYLQNRARH